MNPTTIARQPADGRGLAHARSGSRRAQRCNHGDFVMMGDGGARSLGETRYEQRAGKELVVRSAPDIYLGITHSIGLSSGS